MCKESSRGGFECKFLQRKCDQDKIEFWGCVCDAEGRRVQPKKVEQLAQWPEPRSAEAVNSFLRFVNYLQEHMDPQWIEWGLALRPFRRRVRTSRCGARTLGIGRRSW